MPPSPGTPATALLISSGVHFTAHAYEHDPRSASYGSEAVNALGSALGIEPRRVLKTLLARVGDRLVVAVVPVPAELDLKLLAAAAGGKRARLAPAPEAERASGYVVGGISPLGQRRTLATFVDDSALGHATVFVSGGRRGLEIELSPHRLVQLLDAVTTPLARG